MKHTVIYETLIHCNTKELFEFHADTNNLPLITPPDTKVDILEMQTPLKKGNRAKLKIRKWPLSFQWELVFEEVRYPELIVDVAIRSPFKTFRHEHRFVTVNGTHTILRDTVTFSLPFEPLSTLFVFWIKRDIEKMFAYRHAQTAKHIVCPVDYRAPVISFDQLT